MAVIDYTPHEAGGYTFHRDDGSSMHFAGAEADGLRQWIDASRPPDARLAFDGPGGPAAAPAGPIKIGFDALAGVTTTPAPAPAGAPPAPAPAPSSGGPAISGDAIAAYALRRRHVAGAAAYNPEADAATRRPVPVSRVESGTLALSPEEEKQRIESAKALHAANQSAISEIQAASAERQEAAEARRTQAFQNVIQSEIDQREALAKRDAVENTWNATNARLQKERDAAAEQRVDPDRLFHGPGGTAARIGSAIAVALGAFGSAFTKGPNYAQQIVDSSIQRDIDAQTDAIHRRGAAAQNAVADFQRTYGLTLDEARTAVKATQLRYVAGLADMNAARIGTADAKQNAAVMKANFLQQASADEAKLQEIYKGRQSTSFAMAAPRAATAGYDRNPTSKEVKEDAEAFGAINKAGGSGEGGASERNAARQQQEFELERRVTLPDGGFAYGTSKERADRAQARIDAGGEFKSNLKRMRELLSHTGNSLDPEMRAEYNAIVQRNKLLAKESEDLGAITEADQQLISPITGSGGGNFLTLKNHTLSALRSAEQHVDFRLRQATKQLFKEPSAQTPISRTEESVGIKVGK